MTLFYVIATGMPEKKDCFNGKIRWISLKWSFFSAEFSSAMVFQQGGSIHGYYSVYWQWKYQVG